MWELDATGCGVALLSTICTAWSHRTERQDKSSASLLQDDDTVLILRFGPRSVAHQLVVLLAYSLSLAELLDAWSSGSMVLAQAARVASYLLVAISLEVDNRAEDLGAIAWRGRTLLRFG